jgi:acyl-coenzyme A synthetase/AMP-(fatty) acid ligase
MTRLTLIKQPSEIETAWAEHRYRNDVIRRYWAAVDSGDRDEAGFVWLEAAAYDRANPGSSPITAELDEQALADAA